MYKSQILCIIIILFIAVFNFSSEKKTTAARRFLVLLATSVIQLIFDICSVYTVNHLESISPLLNRVIHCLFMGLMLLLFVIGYKYLEAMIEEETGERIYRVKSIILPFIVGVLGLMFLPIQYIETPRGNYSHGPAVISVYVCVAFCVALIIRLLIRYGREIPEKKRKAVVIAMLSEAPVALYQMLVPTSLISCLAIVLFILGFYMTVENPDAKLVKLLEKETKRADIANQAKTDFLANMSHEIRTPINAILGMNEMILRESGESNVREYAEDVQGAAKSLLSIINDILDVTKIEAGKLTIVPAEYDFAGMVRDVVNMISFKAKAKNLEFTAEIDEKIPGKLLGDDIRIRQILVNLLNNAVKYTHTGSVTLQAELMEHTELEARILFKISDTGIGIKEEDMDKLFVPFERIEEKRNRSIEGTGLGMHITTQLLSLLESRLDVESEYGKGSVFSFVLQQKIMDAEPIGQFDVQTPKERKKEKRRMAFTAPEACVLVVDDNEMNRKVFRSLLKDRKIQVREASSGMECLREVQETSFDIIFMDHMMPEMDGIETFHKMKEMKDCKCSSVPVVILTANAVVGAKEQYLEEGFDAFLSKPIDTRKLDGIIWDLLDPDLIQEAEADVSVKEEKPVVSMEDLPVVEGLDWNYAVLHFKSQDAMRDALRLFSMSMDYEAEELKSYYENINEEEGWKNFRIQVHSMKSSAATVGIIPLSGMAKVLEDAARDHVSDTIHRIMPVFLSCWHSYKEKLSIFADHTEGKKNPQESAGEIDEIFQTIKAAAQEMDIDLLDEAQEKLKAYQFEGEQKELMEKIQTAILNLDTDFLESINEQYMH